MQRSKSTASCIIHLVTVFRVAICFAESYNRPLTSNDWIAHEQENNQLKSIGLDDKKLQNWSTSASSCNDENIGEKKNSNSLNDDKGIVHELQSDDIHEDNELSNSSGGTGGQASFSQSEQ